MKKYVIFLASIFLLLSTFSPEVKAASFTDLKTSDRFYEEAHYLINKGIISGYPGETFKPDKVVSRAEAAIMIGKMLKLDGTKRSSKFTDVYASTAASGYIASAVKKGIISGYPNGTFKPDAPISRGDMAIILSKAFNLSATSAFGFSDVGEQMKAYEHVRMISLASISIGYPNGTYRPNQNVTRAQFAAFLARGLEAKFKQKASIEDSYALDKTKQYTYKHSDNSTIVHTFKDVGVKFGQNLGFVWETSPTKSEADKYYVQSESYEGLSAGYVMSEYRVDLVYPIKVGNSWKDYFDGQSINKITAINKTITTPYKTFTNAVEVTNNRGSKSYYVKNIGFVKSIESNGKMLSELVNVK